MYIGNGATKFCCLAIITCTEDVGSQKHPSVVALLILATVAYSWCSEPAHPSGGHGRERVDPFLRGPPNEEALPPGDGKLVLVRHVVEELAVGVFQAQAVAVVDRRDIFNFLCVCVCV